MTNDVDIKWYRFTVTSFYLFKVKLDTYMYLIYDDINALLCGVCMHSWSRGSFSQTLKLEYFFFLIIINAN